MPAAPIKILHVVYALEPGGMENGLVNLARGLDPAEFAVGICCLEKGGEFVQRLPPAVQVTVGGKPPGFSLAAVVKLAGVFRKARPALIHTHNLGPLLYAGLARTLTRSFPILHGEHGMITEVDRGRFLLWLRRRLYHRCVRVHTVSHSLRQHYLDYGFPGATIETIVNGVDAERFAPADRKQARRQIGVPETGCWLGMIGSLQRRKRHQEVIEAFAAVAQEYPEARLLIVGTGGPEEKKIQASISASPAARHIHLFDFQNDPRPYYQALDLLLVASVNEGLSNAALEAMACGVPVMAGNACGNAEIITPGADGFLVPMDTADEIRGHLVRVLANADTLAGLGQRAREKVTRQFSIAEMVRQYATLYRRCGRAD